MEQQNPLQESTATKRWHQNRQRMLVTSDPSRGAFGVSNVVYIGLAIVVIVAAQLIFGRDTAPVLGRTVRASAPLIFGALCGLIGERSGIVNIGIEGQMLCSAFGGFMASSYLFEAGLPSAAALLAGVAVGALVSMLIGLFMAWCAVDLKMDQIIAGTVVNIFAAGVTSFLYVQGRTQPPYPTWKIPVLRDIPAIGKAFEQGPLTYLAFVTVVVVHIALFRSQWGLRTRAVGEHPSAVDTVGISVSKLRYKNMAIAGMLAGVGGMLLIQSASAFNRNMTNGVGFIALAVMLFGRYRPMGVLAGALILGFFQGLQSQLQFRNAFDMPPQFFGLIPFVLTIAVLAIAGVAARPPAAAGRPYEKE